MFKSTNLKKVALPALILFLLTFAYPIISKHLGTYDVGVQLVTCLLSEFFAYLFTYWLTISKGKPDSHIWIHYAIWYLMFINTYFFT